MKNSIEELVEVVYRYYPRGASYEEPGRAQTSEDRRLVEARLKAGADCERWLDTQRCLNAQFPGMVSGSSVHLRLGTHDACYTGSLYLPGPADGKWYPLAYRVSVLAPYYVVCSSRVVEELAGAAPRKASRTKSPRFASIYDADTMYVLPASVVKPEFREPTPEVPEQRRDVSFDFLSEERPSVSKIAQAIEEIWGYEPLPPEVGTVIVPGVATELREIGEATLYDCLFSDNW